MGGGGRVRRPAGQRRQAAAESALAAVQPRRLRGTVSCPVPSAVTRNPGKKKTNKKRKTLGPTRPPDNPFKLGAASRVVLLISLFFVSAERRRCVCVCVCVSGILDEADWRFQGFSRCGRAARERQQQQQQQQGSGAGPMRAIVAELLGRVRKAEEQVEEEAEEEEEEERRRRVGGAAVAGLGAALVGRRPHELDDLGLQNDAQRHVQRHLSTR